MFYSPSVCVCVCSVFISLQGQTVPPGDESPLSLLSSILSSPCYCLLCSFLHISLIPSSFPVSSLLPLLLCLILLSSLNHTCFAVFLLFSPLCPFPLEYRQRVKREHDSERRGSPGQRKSTCSLGRPKTSPHSSLHSFSAISTSFLHLSPSDTPNVCVCVCRFGCLQSK